MTSRRAWLLAANGAALCACVAANAPWLRGFDVPLLAAHLAAATLLAFALPFVFAYVLARQSVWSAVASIGLFTVYALLAVVRSPRGFDLVVRGLTQGPARLLSATLPFAEPTWLLVVPVAACWMTGALVGESIARGKGDGFPIIVWIVAFVLAFSATAGAANDATVAALALLGLGGAFVLLRRWARDAETAGTGQVVTGVAVLLVAALAGAATPALGVFDAEPVQPQRAPALREPTPVTPTLAVATMRARATEHGAERLFVVTTSGETPGYIALAQLDSYDGDVWRFFRTFAPTGGRLPDVETRALPTVTQHYVIGTLDGLPWMPYVPTAREVDGVGVGYDDATGMIVPDEPLARGARYSVVSRVLAEPLDAVDLGSKQTLGGISNNARDVLPPVIGAAQLADAVAALEEELARDAAGDPIGFLAALEQQFRTYARVDDGPPDDAIGEVVAGTSLGDVLSTILTKREGTPEQFATAYALIARQIGVPARVATGFRLVDGDGTLPAGRYEVDTSDAWTWVEIATPDGWRVADPTPTGTSTTPPATAGASAGATTTTVIEHTIEETATPARTAAAERSPRRQGSSPVPVLVVGGAIAVVLLCVALPVSYRVRRVRRRRRRARGTPRERVVGAWHEMLETLAEVADVGLGPMTAREVSEAAARHVGPSAAAEAARVGAHANVALFAPTAVLDDDAATDAWQSARAFRTSVRAATPWRRRLTALLRIRSPRHAAARAPVTYTVSAQRS